jgi:hypothetical protein
MVSILLVAFKIYLQSGDDIAKMTAEKTENPLGNWMKENRVLPRKNSPREFPKQSSFGVKIRG